MKIPFAFVFSAALLSANVLSADMAFFENFNGSTLNPNMNVSNGYFGYLNVGGTIGNVGGIRNTVRTNDSDYRNFVYELTLAHSGFNPNEIAFIGIGSGEPEGFWQEPGFGSLTMRIHNPGLAGGRVDFHYADDLNGTTGAISEGAGNITSYNTPIRTRITRIGDQLTFGYDIGFNGTYLADYSRTWDLSEAQYSAVRTALNGTTRLFFGSQFNQSRFDDFAAYSSIPEPGTAMFAAIGLAGVVISTRRRSFKS